MAATGPNSGAETTQQVASSPQTHNAEPTSSRATPDVSISPNEHRAINPEESHNENVPQRAEPPPRFPDEGRTGDPEHIEDGAGSQATHSSHSLLQPTEKTPYGWRPRYLRRRVFGLFIAGFLILAALIVLLWAISKQRNGLTAAKESLYYLWMFSPTIAFTVLLSVWTRVDYQIKRYMPWIQLAHSTSPNARRQRGSPIDSRRALFLDYANMAQVKVAWTSWKHRDLLVWGSTMLSWLFFVQITLSTGLLNLEDVAMQETTALNVYDAFEQITGTDQDVLNSKIPSLMMNGMAILNLSLPLVHHLGNAFQRFGPRSDADSASLSQYASLETTLDVTWVDPICERLDVTAEQWDEDAMANYFGLDISFDSPHCETHRHIISSVNKWDVPPLGQSYYWVYNEKGNCKFPGVQSDSTSTIISAVIEVNTTEDQIQYVASSAFACQVALVLAEQVPVTVTDGLDITAALDAATASKTLDGNIVDHMKRFRGDDLRDGAEQQMRTGSDYVDAIFLSPYRLGARITPGGVPSVPELLDGRLEDLVKAWIRVVSAKGTVLRQRLIVKESTAWSMFGVSIVMTGLLLFMYVEAARTSSFSSFVTRDPDSIAGCAALLAKSEQFLDSLMGTGDANVAELKRRLRERTVQPCFYRPDRFPRSTSSSSMRAPQTLPPPRGRERRQRQGERAWFVYLSSMVPPTVVPTLFFEALAIYLKSCDFNIRFLTPMVTLQSGEVHFDEAVGISYANAFGPVVLWKALRHRNWNVFLSKVIAWLVTLLPIVTNALFAVEMGEVRQTVQLQQQTWFAADDSVTSSYEAPSAIGGMLLADKDANMSFPQWTYEEYAIHRQAILQGGEELVGTVQASVPAVAVSSKPSVLSVKYGDEGLTCLRNIKCEDHTYFGAVLGGEVESSSCGKTGLPATSYVWGVCEGNEVTFIKGLNCTEVAHEIDLDVRFLDAQMRLDTIVYPPTPKLDTRRQSSFHGEADSLYSFIDFIASSHLGLPSNSDLHGLFEAVTRSRWAVPLEKLGLDSASEEVAAAISKHHGIIRAQTLNYDGRPSMAQTPVIRRPFDEDGDLPAPKYPPLTADPPAPFDASLRTAENRLLQKKGATWTVIAILAAILLLQAALLADSSLFMYLPDDAEWRSDGKLSKHFGGVKFRIGRFPAMANAETPIDGSEHEQALEYTIGIVEGEEAMVGMMGDFNADATAENTLGPSGNMDSATTLPVIVVEHAPRP
ncbi:unnamed protein product [Parascedosporium putredinis]|uniref:Uncharacterized protein n=1 Tax=Parascedosporium putredinis TaxID=1442378 RepID=A0A9P1H4M0_9PEZI|nr:unnamed protein product [Parascedosporium putredinis]CAI7996740.1 unnamed protein product [Parascedosporium putredinis]